MTISFGNGDWTSIYISLVKGSKTFASVTRADWSPSLILIPSLYMLKMEVLSRVFVSLNSPFVYCAASARMAIHSHIVDCHRSPGIQNNFVRVSCRATFLARCGQPKKTYIALISFDNMGRDFGFAYNTGSTVGKVAILRRVESCNSQSLKSISK